jgi:2'-5' RNA ligase
VIRCFVAIPLPPEVISGIARIQKRLRELELDASWPAVQGLHLTLKFLGNVEEVRVPEVAAALQRVVEGRGELELLVRGVGAFPRLSDPRVVWVGVDGGSGLADLQSAIEKRLTALGYPREERPFRPHLTAARVRSRRNVARLIRFLEVEAVDLGAFHADRVHLYQSLLRPEGAEYRVLETAALGRP